MRDLADEPERAGFRPVRDDESVEHQAVQTASLAIEPSEYGFAVLYRLDGSEPAVLVHRREEQNAQEQHRLHTKFLVDVHGWEVVGVDGSTTYLQRPRPLDAEQPGG